MAVGMARRQTARKRCRRHGRLERPRGDRWFDFGSLDEGFSAPQGLSETWHLPCGNLTRPMGYAQVATMLTLACLPEVAARLRRSRRCAGLAAALGTILSVAQAVEPAATRPDDLPFLPALYPYEFSFDLTNVTLPAAFNGPQTLGQLNLSETRNDASQTPGSAINPFLSFRFSAWVTPPGGGQSYLIPGFYAGDGSTGSTTPGSLGDIGVGAVWKLRFAPDERQGYWNLVFLLDYDNISSPPGPINASDAQVPASPWQSGTSGPLVPGVLWGHAKTIYSSAINPNAGGHYGRGFLRSEARTGGTSRYLMYSWQGLPNEKRYFIKIGVNSPENWFGCKDFYKSGKNLRYVMHPENVAMDFPMLNRDGPGSGIWHAFDKPPVGGSHTSTVHSSMADWQNGPEWNTTRLDVTHSPPAAPVATESDALAAGHGIIGALRYLSTNGVNSIYVGPMSLGGDGRDTHPFASINVADYSYGAQMPVDATSVFNYSIRRAIEWNIVINFAMSMGILVQLQLHEHEESNLDWLDYD